jgi:Transposase domain (DUF772)
VLPENRFFTIRYRTYLPICGHAALDQLLPKLRVYESGAIRTRVPTYGALTGWVLTQVLEAAAKITAHLADPAVDEALYDSATLRRFARIDLGAEPVPDETTICKFRHVLEAHKLGCLTSAERVRAYRARKKAAGRS